MRLSNRYSELSLGASGMPLSICPIETEKLDVTLIVPAKDAHEITRITVHGRLDVNFKGLAADIAELLDRAGHRRADCGDPPNLADIQVRPAEAAAIRFPSPGRYDPFGGLRSNQRD